MNLEGLSPLCQENLFFPSKIVTMIDFLHFLEFSPCCFFLSFQYWKPFPFLHLCTFLREILNLILFHPMIYKNGNQPRFIIYGVGPVVYITHQPAFCRKQSCISSRRQMTSWTSQSLTIPQLLQFSFHFTMFPLRLTQIKQTWDMFCQSKF